MPKSFVDQATARCSVAGSKFYFNCNPAGPQHWFNQEWILKTEQKNAIRLHFTMDDNLSLSEEVKNRYKSMYEGVFYQRYIEGLWVAAEGLIYDMFDKDTHVLTKTPETEGDYYVSSDYGIQNATVFLLWRKVKDTNKWICLKEYYYSGRDEKKQKTVSQLVEDMKAWLNGIMPKCIIVDPSAAALIVEMRRAGYKVLKAKNDVLDGIADVGTMLHAGRLLFMNTCKETINEFGVYSWDPKAAARGEDKPIKEHDHAQDACRYLVRTLGLVKRDKAASRDKDSLYLY